MKNTPKKILKSLLKFLLGICIFFVALFIGYLPKSGSDLNNTHTELITTINNSKEDLTQKEEELSKAKAQKEDLEKQLNTLNDSLNKTNESIKQLENSTNN
ncbi:hypothetical protein P6O23_07325 [Clostridium perfringens]|uniref:hypothetical protein n=1 Tax=Clostridium perfringens TaxID=1502 RepID=UPI001F06847A|nr:hypothetical protein [Clostridium perfringens]MCH1962394.1 hypothetical protein [Clostridium perfringens]MDK0537926.1 hypothetical protein [Clostridium perfringens]MDK0570769.1 hypothetical protein [Clostridium perfringens]MDM0454502.1 hypothetical protein [Clostridium perfringens]MDM0469099.1 hypothetical protein [Clostridium perfringens]